MQTTLPATNDAAPNTALEPLTTFERASKRVVDVISAAVLLLLTWPIVLVAAIAIKATSRGPVFYVQTRVGLNARAKGPDRRRQDTGPPAGTLERRGTGTDRRAERRHGRHFTMFKLRTMGVDAEANGAQLAEEDDPRVTRVGRFLRRTRIDELPQLYNVLRGDMSLVGPRPERPEFVDQLHAEIPDYLDRLGIKPGVTGLAQVLNGYDEDLSSVRRKIALDLRYRRRWSLALDLEIMVRTVGVVVTGSGSR